MTPQEKVVLRDDLLLTNNSPAIYQDEVTFLISRQTYLEFEYMFLGFAIPLLSAFGVFANIANIVVFTKMGLKETTNILFFVISITDLVLLLVFFSVGCTVNGAFASINTLFLDPYDIGLVINPFTWVCFGLGSCLTALIAVERSVCIMFPLEVKLLFTRRRILVAIGLFSTLPLANLIQKFATQDLSWATVPGTNHTGLVFTYTAYSQVMDLIAGLAFSVTPSIISFLVVGVGTGFLVFKLNQSSRWRKSSSSVATHSKVVSNKEVKVIRSAVLVCIVYIICFTPNVCIIAAALIRPRLHIVDPYYGPFIYVALYIANFCQGVSSSFNICIYISTSTNFRETFMVVFCCRQDKKAVKR